MAEGQKLVSFLDRMMSQNNSKIAVDRTVKKDATEKEMKSYCKEYACSKCPIFQRCSMAAKMFEVNSFFK